MQGNVGCLQGMQQQSTRLSVMMGFRGWQQLGKCHEAMQSLSVVLLEIGWHQTGLRPQRGDKGLSI
jgi:hypothetical protein